VQRDAASEACACGVKPDPGASAVSTIRPVVVGEIGDPGGLIILVLRSDDGGWLAKVCDGHTPLSESGFQTALDDIVARLRLRCDLCLYSATPPTTPEGMRNFARIMPPGPGRR
jgi:hypothetical protein